MGSMTEHVAVKGWSKAGRSKEQRAHCQNSVAAAAAQMTVWCGIRLMRMKLSMRILIGCTDCCLRRRCSTQSCGHSVAAEACLVQRLYTKRSAQREFAVSVRLSLRSVC
jgi:hypothetical protein